MDNTETPPPPPDWKIISTMINLGGSFAKALAKAAALADDGNLAIIKTSWPSLLDKYAEMSGPFCDYCHSWHPKAEGCKCVVCGCGLHPEFIRCRRGLHREKQAWCPSCDDATPATV